jgi:glucose-6-phosphate isomerase
MPNLIQARSWQALAAHRKKMAKVRMSQLFSADPRRFEHYSLQVGDLLLDYSKNLIDGETREVADVARA